MGLAAFVERVVAHVRAAPVEPSLLPPDAIVGTLFSGAAGVAFFLHEAARLRDDDGRLLPLARRWLDVADRWTQSAKPEDWFHLERGHILGEAGTAYVDALLSSREGDVARAHRAVLRVDRATPGFDGLGRGMKPADLVAGASGVVCLARDLAARLPSVVEYAASREVLGRVLDRALAVVMAACTTPVPDDGRLGLAHGVAGELWPLLQVLGAEHPVVKARLGELAAFREVDEEGLVFWLANRGNWDLKMVGTWCNGTAGHALLWAEVARLTRSAEAMELARLAAESTVILGDMTAGVCCGLAGHSLALQRYADLSGDAKAARRAYDRLVRATRLCEPTGPYGLGLWQGTLGVALVAMARLRDESTFPLLEPPV